MIVSTDDLGEYRGIVAMVDGGFDPLHAGHVEYFREASSLDAPLLCNVSSDEWVARKHPPLLPQSERARIIDAIRYVDYTHLSPGLTTVEVLSRLEPRFYVKGSDWEGRLPEDEQRVCTEAGVEVVFLDTVRNSSSGLLRDYEERLKSRADGAEGQLGRARGDSG